MPEDTGKSYESPFKIPKCNWKKTGNGNDPARWPNLHESNDKCPLHSRASSNWTDWYIYREKFATDKIESNREYYLDKMLGFVTLENPPDAPSLVKRKPAIVKKQLSWEAAFCLAALTAVGVTFLVVMIAFFAIG
jgi:hypothetical protein